MKRAWRSFKTNDLVLGDETLATVTGQLNSFDWLPRKVRLSNYESELIAQMEETGQSGDFVTLTRALHQRVCSPEDHVLRRRNFARLATELSNEGFKLSSFVQEFFTSDQLVERFRTGYAISIEGSSQLPGKESRLVDFLVDPHGGGTWSLLVSRDRNEAVVYEDEGGWHDPKRYDAIYLVADSFSEFLWRASIEIVEREQV